MSVVPKISWRQKKVLDFIEAYTHKHGFPPSIREIGADVGLSSSSTVHSHLKALVKKGFLERELSKPRSMSLKQRGPSRLDLAEQLLARCAMALLETAKPEDQALGVEVTAFLPAATEPQQESA